jgi:hypothetical protein
VQFHVAHDDAEIRGLVGVCHTNSSDYKLRPLVMARVKVLSDIAVPWSSATSHEQGFSSEAVMDNFEAVLH